jgi:hypothetical protein
MRLHQGWKIYRALKLAVLGLAGGLSACSPLAQAPLVYSSKQTLGLDVSTTSTETPGIAINLGFKNIDAAYVPVAVAKQCDSNQGQTICDPSKSELTLLTARTEYTDTNAPQAQIATQANLDLQRAREVLLEKQAELDNRLSTRDADIKIAADRKTAEADLTAAQALAATPPAGADEATVRAAQTAQANLPTIQERVDIAHAAEKKAATNQQAVEAATQARDNAKDKVDTAAITLAKANADRAKSLNATRQDAFSVYGSFGGRTDFSGTGEHGAGLVVGKMFSTGVASQQLTAGIRSVSCMQAATQAAAEINKSTTMQADKKDALIAANYEYCNKTLAED